MKKLFSVILCVSLASFNFMCFAAETPPIKVSITSIPLQSALDKKYSAYRVDYINEGQNAVRINSAKCYNRVAYADTYGLVKRVNKTTKLCTLLFIPTLGLSSFVMMGNIMKGNEVILTAQSEARRFNALDLTSPDSSCLKTSNEILGQGQDIQFNVLVPLNETPEMVGNFEDTVSHKYIRVEGTK